MPSVGLRRGVGAEVDHGRDATVRPWISRSSTERSPSSGEPAYRARQVWEWTSRGAVSYEDMTTLPKALRATLVERGPVLDSRGRDRARVEGRHRQGALPDRGRPSGRGRAHALPRRPPLALSLVAVGLPADVHVLRDGRDALRPQPDLLGDHRPGAALPPARDGESRRVHGHGRAVPQRGRRTRVRAPAPRPRHHPPAHDDLDRRLDAWTAPLRRRGRPADPARALAPCCRRRRSARSSCR